MQEHIIDNGNYSTVNKVAQKCPDARPRSHEE
jgi:hypothetical protein